MSSTPPSPAALRAAAPTRRHRSRQRERILAWLRETDTHPTAAEIHDALRPRMQGLSLGTVYRNLDVLVAEGEIEEVPSALGATRYDGNVRPHHHFHCERCGRIVDLALPVPRGLTRRLEREQGLRASRVRISCFGLCATCAAGSEAGGESRNETRPRRRSRRNQDG